MHACDLSTWRLRQEDCKLKASPGFTVGSCLKKQIKTKQHTQELAFNLKSQFL